VIPVAIEYPKTKDYWFEPSMAKQIFGQIGAWSTHVKLHISEPIKNTDAEQLMTAVQDEIDQNLTKMQEGWSEIFAQEQQRVN